MKIRILIVDDQKENLYLLQSLLKGNGYDVTSAENGELALKAAIKNPPDLIISDVLMPVMDGFTLCKKWKAHAKLQVIPFVFYTATYTDSKDEEFAKHLGADSFIIKPQEPGTLILKINEILKKLSDGEFTPTAKSNVDESVQLEEYNQALIRKLEDKMCQLEEVNKQLTKVLNRYKSLLITAPDAIFILNEQTKIIEANNQACKLFGYSDAEILGMDINNLHASEDQEKVIEALQNMDEKTVGKFDWIYKRKDGTVFPGSLRIMLKQNTGFQMIIRDISERKEAEKKIETQLNELQQWYNITLGREERMIELKGEVNELLVQLNKPKKYDVGKNDD